MTQIKLEAKQRISNILTAGLELAKEHGYQNVTREAIAEKAGMSTGLVSTRMGTMKELKRKLMREAIRVECLPVIAQGLAMRDPHARKCPEPLQKKALASAVN